MPVPEVQYEWIGFLHPHNRDVFQQHMNANQDHRQPEWFLSQV